MRVAATLIALALSSGSSGVPVDAQRELPNILWLSSEDNGPQLGAYGDDFADTPNLDALAQKGMAYRVAWSNAPVCGAARSTIITGMYPTSLGSQHMRSRVPLPADFKLFPAYLREAGYYTTNAAKTDYNLVGQGAAADALSGSADGSGPASGAATERQLVDEAWNDSSGTAHWRNRPQGAPFFSVFNFGEPHESQIRARPHDPVHDPAAVRVPAFHPDIPEVRSDWAQYYDQVSEMDARVGARLAELEADGLSASTVIVYFGDHGPGLPRGKRTAKDSGLRVPLIVYVPERFRDLAPEGWQAGALNDRLVGFVDLAPTMLSLAGVEPPGHMQGSVFLGQQIGEAADYLYGFRGRMDERDDLVRAVRDQRFVYVRNYLPHRPDGQHVDYMFRTPTTRAWKQLFDRGALPAEQAAFWEARVAEELYDLQEDPDEVVNLATSSEDRHREALQRMRAAQRLHVMRTGDLGFLPEADMYARSEITAAGIPRPGATRSTTPYEMGRDPAAYPLSRVFQAAEQASDVDLYGAGSLRSALLDPDAAVRYWAVVGMIARGQGAVQLTRDGLFVALDDDSPSVRIAAAEALGRFGDETDLEAALAVLMSSADLDERPLYEVVAALNAIDYLDERAAGIADRLATLPRERDDIPPPLANFVPRLLEKILADLGVTTGTTGR